jgi:hypothetical protein
MLSLEPQDLMDEIRDAKNLRDKVLANVNEIKARIAGNYYRTDSAQDATPENYAYQWLAFVMTQVVYERPTITAESMAGPQADDQAKAIEEGLNHWAKVTELKPLLVDLAWDVLTGYGMTVKGLELRGQVGDGANDAAGNFTAPATLPFMARVPLADVIIDAHCKDRRAARLIGRSLEYDVADLQNDSRYDLSALGGEVTPTNQLAENGVERGPFPISGDPSLRRKRCKVYEIYIPEAKRLISLLDRGNGQSGTIIRDEEYYGPDDGPFRLWGVDFIPDQLYPLSPLQAVWEQFLQLQDHCIVVDDAASREKRVVLVDQNDPGANKAIEKANNGDIIPVRNLNGTLPINIGGPSDGALKNVMMLRDRLDRQMGFTSTQAGKSNSDTATSNTLSQANSDARVERIRQSFAEHLRADLRDIAWFLFNEQSVIFKLSVEHPKTGQMVAATFAGGTDWPGQEGSDFADMHIDIDVHSMMKTDDALQQKRVQDIFAITTQAAPAMVQAPWINWKEIFEMLGASLNMKGLGDRIINAQVLQAMGVPWGMASTMSQGMMPPGAMPQPGLAIGPMQSAMPQVGAATVPGMQRGLMAGAR